MRLRRFAVAMTVVVGFAGCSLAGIARTAAPVSMRTLSMEQDGATIEMPYCGNGALASKEPVRTLVIVVHGDDRNACDYASWAVESARRAGDLRHTLVVAPAFQVSEDLDGRGARRPYWSSGGWKTGATSLSSPHRRDFEISSFAVVDEMVTRARRQLSGLDRVVVAGHSAGGQFTNRYAAGTNVEGIDRFVVANPSSYLYLDERRWDGGGFSPLTADDRDDCPEVDEYKYGLEDLNPYMEASGADGLRARYASRRVVYLLGAEDTSTTSSSLDRSCAAERQGDHRLERGIRFHQYLEAFYGPNVNQRHVRSVVPSVGHDGEAMLTSERGQAALFG